MDGRYVRFADFVWTCLVSDEGDGEKGLDRAIRRLGIEEPSTLDGIAHLLLTSFFCFDLSLP